MYLKWLYHRGHEYVSVKIPDGRVYELTGDMGETYGWTINHKNATHTDTNEE